MNTIDIKVPDGKGPKGCFGTKVFVSGSSIEVDCTRIQIDMSPDSILEATLTIPVNKCNMEYLQSRFAFESLEALAKSEGYELVKIEDAE